MRKIQVGLDERSYPILIHANLLNDIGNDLKDRNIAKRYVVVADEYVAELFGQQLMDSLSDAGISADLITFPRGEASKNLATFSLPALPASSPFWSCDCFTPTASESRTDESGGKASPSSCPSVAVLTI